MTYKIFKILLFFSVIAFLLLPIFETTLYFNNSSNSKDSDYILADQTNNASPVNVIFFGDVMLGRHVEFLSERNGIMFPFSNFPSMLSGTDHVFVNFESSMSDPHVRTKSGEFKFSVTKEAVAALKRAGVTHASLANNHALDYGNEGLLNTRLSLEENSISYFGHPINLDDGSFAELDLGFTKKAVVVGLHTLFKEPELDIIKKKLDVLKEKYSYIIFYIHWGDEYILTHNKRQQELAHYLIDNGADLIVGHHPHVVQDIESYKGKLVFYSLGNTIFDQYFERNVQYGIYLKLTNYRNGTCGITINPISYEKTRSQPYLLTGQEKESFLNDMSLQSKHNNVSTSSLAKGEFEFDCGT